MKRIAKLTTFFALTSLLGFAPNLARAGSTADPGPGQKPQCKMTQRGMGGAMESEGMGGTMMHGKAVSGTRKEHKESMRGRRVARNPERMLQRRKEIVAKLEAMKSNLDHKLVAMNKSTGRDKVAAMAAVVNDLVHQRDQFFNHFIDMQRHVIARVERHEQRERSMGGAGETGGGVFHGEHHWKEHGQK